MDVSTNILNDPKFRKFQRLYPDRVAAGVTAYLAVMSESWKAGRRVSIHDAWPAILPFDEAVIPALMDVGLLDRRGYLPLKTWDGWFGPAQKRRDENRERWRRYNDERRRLRTDNDASPTELPRGNHVATTPIRTYRSVPSVPTVPSMTDAEKRRHDEEVRRLETEYSRAKTS